MLQIDDPLVERLYAVLVDKPAGNAIGAVNRLQAILGQYYGFEAQLLPEHLSARVNPTPLVAGESSCSPP
jgi:hypothetical protein